jgi:TPP-dependent pyruvate/acetoin dehydrogenase alpha subunit
MMRMKGHAIHDAAEYVPKPLFEYWKRRDPIARLEDYLVIKKKWLTSAENEKLIAGVEQQLEGDREIAVNSPMPTPESAAGGVYCEAGCHEIKPKYAVPDSRTIRERGGKSADPKRSETAVHLK